MNKWSWVVLSVVLFQANDILLRLFSSNTNFVAGSIIQVIPLAVGCGVVIYKSPKLNKINMSKSSLKLIILFGILQIFMGNMLYFTAMQYGGLSIASPTVQSQAIWAVILGMFLLKEKVSPLMWLGISIFAAGILGIAYFKSAGTQMQSGWVFGVASGLIGGLCWAAAAATQKRLLNSGVELMYILFFGILFGIVFLVIFGFASIGNEFTSEFLKIDTYKMLVVGIFSGGAIWCISQAVKLVPISKVIPSLSINIIFNTITGHIFFGEFINAGTFISMLIVVFGIVSVNEPSKALRIGLGKKNKRSVI